MAVTAYKRGAVEVKRRFETLEQEIARLKEALSEVGGEPPGGTGRRGRGAAPGGARRWERAQAVGGRGMAAGGRLNASETRSREAVSRLPDRLARRGLASLRFSRRTACGGILPVELTAFLTLS